MSRTDPCTYMYIYIYICVYQRQIRYHHERTQQIYLLQIELNNDMTTNSNELSSQSFPKGVQFDGYQPPNWNEFFMLKVYLTGTMKSHRRI